MNHEDQIKELEEKEKSLMLQSIEKCPLSETEFSDI